LSLPTEEGLLDSISLGASEGEADNSLLGSTEGKFDGLSLLSDEGLLENISLGAIDREADSSLLGYTEGKLDCLTLPPEEGLALLNDVLVVISEGGVDTSLLGTAKGKLDGLSLPNEEGLLNKIIVGETEGNLEGEFKGLPLPKNGNDKLGMKAVVVDEGLSKGSLDGMVLGMEEGKIDDISTSPVLASAHSELLLPSHPS
jgi:hypothetical protein